MDWLHWRSNAPPLSEIDERVEFGESSAAIKRSCCFGESGLEVAGFGGEGGGGVEQDGVAACACEFTGEVSRIICADSSGCRRAGLRRCRARDQGRRDPVHRFRHCRFKDG